LKPIKAKSAFEVAGALIEIFSMFGVPVILQSDNGREFLEEWSKLETAKQLFEAVGYEGNIEEMCLNLPENEDIDTVDDVFDPRDYELNLEDDNKNPQSNVQELGATNSAQIGKNANSLLGIRENVRSNQARQAEAMRTRSKRYIPEVSIGDFVALPIPDVDRGLTEAPNLICRIVDIDYAKSLYELACEAGVLNTLFARNSFDLVKDCSIEIQIRLDKQVSLR
ncbi:unnamed protein product, partial [Brachionus calyciflorus]